MPFLMFAVILGGAGTRAFQLAPSSRCVLRRSMSAAHLEEAKRQIGDGSAVLVDVREEKEYKEGHFRAATLAPYTSQLQAEVPPALLGETRPLYVHCAKGGRAKKAAEILKANGLDAVALTETFEELKDARLAELEG